MNIFAWVGLVLVFTSSVFAAVLIEDGNISDVQSICLSGTCITSWNSVDSFWSIASSLYLYNNSGTLELNETRLNATIDARAVGQNEYPNLDTNANDNVNTTTNFGGDVSGTFDSIVVLPNSTLLDWDNITGKPTNLDTDSTDDLTTSGGTISGSLTINTNLQVDGNLTVLGDIVTLNVSQQSVNGSILPQLDSSFNVGSSTLRWSNIFADTLNGSLSWLDLTGVPAGLADGDDDTTYSESDKYLTLTGTVFGLDETVLNATIDARDSDTTYDENDKYLTLGGTTFGFNETILNATIDARDSQGYWTNSSGDIELQDANVGIKTQNTNASLHVNGTILANNQDSLNRTIVVETGSKICLDGFSCQHFIWFNGTATVIE